MTASSTAPAKPELTRPSGLGPRGVLLPGAVLVAALLMTVTAFSALDGLYRRDAGVIRAEQLLPYALAWRHGAFASSGPDSAARSEAERRWLDAAAPLAVQAAAVSWRDGDGRDVLVLAARTEDPARLVASLRASARAAERATAWTEGDRVAMAVVVSRSVSADDTSSVLDQRAGSVRSSVQLQRAVALAAAALVPVVLLFLSVGVATVAVVAVAAIVGVLVVLPVRLITRRRGPQRTGHPVDEVRLPSGVLVMRLPPRWRVHSTVSTWRVVPLALVALPAATVSLWPGSLVWAGIIALILVLAMPWARGSKPALWLRRLLYAVVGLGLAHALLGWPPELPMLDVRVLAGLVAALLAVVVLALRRQRGLRPAVLDDLELRWLVMLVGLLVLAASSFAVFLGSNGETDPSRQLGLKALALPGLVAIPVSARRLRAARTLSVRERLRRANRPEVLYLRSFVDDGLRVRSERRARAGLERWLPWPTELFEDVLVRGFEQVGPVVAIGKPGSDQTELGAGRDLVVGPDWVAAVEAEMDRVRLITVVLGHGEGLATELRALCERGRLDHVCIVVPPVSAAEVAARLSAGTRALERGRGWGRLDDHALRGQGEIVALVGWQGRRYVVVAERRARASTYGALAAVLSHEIVSGGRF